MDYKTTTAYRNAVGRGHVLDVAPAKRTTRPSVQAPRPSRSYARSGYGQRPIKAVRPAAAPTKQAPQSAPVRSAAASTAIQYPLPAYQAPARLPLTVGRKSFIRGVRRAAVGTMAIVFLVSGFIAWRGYAAANKVLSGTTTVAALSSSNVLPTDLESEGDGRVNIALLGIGGTGHDGGDLTDTIIVVSIDPVNHKATMVSVPRDLWIKMPNSYYGTYQKINAAYSAGKYSFLKKTNTKSTDTNAIDAGFDTFDTAISQVLGMRVDYHVLVDFKAFKQAVDTVGGVTVDVKSNLVDPTMAWENSNSSVIAAAGEQQMDGEQALLYARSRHTSSDFARSERQRELIMALKEKLFSMNTLSDPTKLNSLMNVLGDNIHTDVSTTAAMQLYRVAKNITDSDVMSLDLTSSEHRLMMTDRVGSTSVVRPTRGYDTYSDIQAYIRPYMRDGYLVKEAALVATIAPTQAIADDTQQTLTTLGYSTLAGTVQQGGDSAATVTLIDLSAGAAPYTKHYLEKRYHMAATTVVPDGISVPSGAKFVILVTK